MMSASRVRAVAVFEFRSSVLRWSYLLVTLGLPLLLGGVAGGAVFIQMYFFATDSEHSDRFAIVDESSLFGIGERVVEGTVIVDRLSRGEARKALVAREIDAFFVFPADYVTHGRVLSFTLEDTPPLSAGSVAVERVLRDLVRRTLLQNRVSQEIIDRVVDPMDLEPHTLSRVGGIETAHDAAGWSARLALPVVIAALLSIALVSSTALLAQALTLEKQNKIVEMLVASVSPEEILTGKLIGLGAAGLLQVVLWFGVTGATSAFAAPLTGYVALIPWTALAVIPPYFVMGYLFVGSFMLASAALGTSAPENQKVGAVWALLTTLPVMLMLVISQQPEGTVARVLSWFPFTAPVTVILRLAVSPDSVPLWELIGSFALLTLCTWAALRVGARLFRVGLLLTGNRLRWKDIVRQARP